MQVFSFEIGGVFFINSVIYRTPPVAASVVFAVKQCNIQCYNVKTKNCHRNTVIIITLPRIKISIFY